MVRGLSGPVGRLLFVIGLAQSTGCTGRGSPTAPPPIPCPPAVALGQPAQHGSVFIDGRPVAANLPVRRTNDDPEAYELAVAEPPDLAAIPVGRIDLVQYLRGPDAEQRYGICPGTVAILFTTRSPT